MVEQPLDVNVPLKRLVALEAARISIFRSSLKKKTFAKEWLAKVVGVK